MIKLEKAKALMFDYNMLSCQELLLAITINCIISGYFPTSPAIYFKHLITYGNGPKKNASQYNLGTTTR